MLAQTNPHTWKALVKTINKHTKSNWIITTSVNHFKWLFILWLLQWEHCILYAYLRFLLTFHPLIYCYGCWRCVSPCVCFAWGYRSQCWPLVETFGKIQPTYPTSPVAVVVPHLFLASDPIPCSENVCNLNLNSCASASTVFAQSTSASKWCPCERTNHITSLYYTVID